MSSAQLQLYQVYVWSVTQVLNRGRSAFLAADRDTRGRERETGEERSQVHKTAPLVSLLWLRALRLHASRY